MTKISQFAFQNCTGLTSITIPDGVTEIWDYAFTDCTGLTSVTIPASVTFMGEGAFDGCTGLTGVYISDLAKWCAINFGYKSETNPLYYAHNLYLNNQLVTELIIPDSVTKISHTAFQNCTVLTSVTIPASVTSIGNYAFQGCTELTTVNWNATACKYAGSSNKPSFWAGRIRTLNIGENVTTIPAYAFSNCSALTSVTIPASVTSIGDYAFEYCEGLISVTMLPTTPPTLTSSPFVACSKLAKIIVPAGTGDTYKTAAKWSNYADKIVEATV